MASESAASSWVLADSQVWVEYFSGKDNAYTREADQLLEARRLCMAGPVLYEVLVGVKDEGRRLYLRSQMLELHLLQTTLPVWLQTVRCGLRTVARYPDFPAGDVLIAAHCLTYGCALLARDPHFDVFHELRRHKPGR